MVVIYVSVVYICLFC